MPNLAVCRRLESEDPAVIRLFQVGVSQCPFWRIEARATLEVWEETLVGDLGA